MVKPKAKVNDKLCLSCGGCVSICPSNAIILKNLIANINPKKCTSCNICYKTCPIGAIFMED